MGALGSLLGGLGGPREPWPESLADHGRELLPPPVGNVDLGPPPSRQFHYFLRPREEENETMELKNRRSKVQGRDGRRVHGRDGRKEERDDGTEGRRDPPHASMAQGAGGLICLDFPTFS